MEEFLQNIIDLGVILPNGECAWKKDEIKFVLNEFKKYDVAINGGEVWALDINASSTIPKLAKTTKKINVLGTLPMKDGSTSVEHWNIVRVENWEQFKIKSFNESLSIINSIEKDIKERIIDKYRNHIYYCLFFCEKKDFFKK